MVICNEIIKRKNGRALIVAPLGVRQEFKKDATNKLGINITYVRTIDEVNQTPDNLFVLPITRGSRWWY